VVKEHLLVLAKNRDTPQAATTGCGVSRHPLGKKISSIVTSIKDRANIAYTSNLYHSVFNSQEKKFTCVYRNRNFYFGLRKKNNH
jgi:hypothetical protein